MQVQIIRGERGTGKTTYLQAVQADLKHQGIDAPIMVGERFTTPYFLNQLSHQAIAGAKYFLADDCTLFQVRAVLALAAEGEKSGLPYDLVVHLVHQAQ